MIAFKGGILPSTNMIFITKPHQMYTLVSLVLKHFELFKQGMGGLLHAEQKKPSTYLSIPPRDQVG